jgi:molybdate transport system substrate-binding protein
MNDSSSGRWGVVVTIVGAILLMCPLTAAAQLKVLISGGFSGPYEKLLPEFERTTGITVTTGSGSSEGAGPQTIGAQLARGAPADVVILSRQGLTELINTGRIVAGTDVDLARTPLGLAVRSGATRPDVSTVEAFKQVMLNSNAVAIPSSTSGIFLTETIFPRLGIADRVKAIATPRGTGAVAMVAAGEADVAVMPVSEIVHAPGVDLAGVIPEEIQLNQVFAAAVVAESNEVEAAKQLITFLASGRASETISGSGMEPLTSRR